LFRSVKYLITIECKNCNTVQ